MSTVQDLILEQIDLLNKVDLTEQDWDRIELIGNILDHTEEHAETDVHMEMEIPDILV